MTAAIGAAEAEAQARIFQHAAKDDETGCWIWSRGTGARGYGRLTWHGKARRAHRLVAHLLLGLDIDDPLAIVRHHCDNPSCVNPAHLAIGTLKDNAQDAVRRGRHSSGRKTHCNHGHPFDEANTYVDKRGRRNCRTCGRAHRAKYRKSGRQRFAPSRSARRPCHLCGEVMLSASLPRHHRRRHA